MNKRDPLKIVRKRVRKGELPKAARECMAILRSEPKNIEAIELYANIAMQMNRFSEAIVVYRKLLTLQPKNLQAHENLALIFRSSGDHYTAKVHAQAAIEIDSMQLDPHIVLGAVLFSEGKTEEAEREFQAANNISPGNPDVENALIDSLLAAGDFRQAADRLRVLIAKYPGDSSLYVNLARCQKLIPDSADVAIIRGLLKGDGQLLAANRTTANQKVDAHMALFKLESDLDNLKPAFEHLKTAKDIRKAQYPFDVKASAQGNLEFREIFTADFVAEKSRFGSTAKNPIFIVGMPRSGTTLLERVLSAHEQISAAGELSLLDQLEAQACARYGKNQYDPGGLLKVPDSAWQELGDEYVRRVQQRGITTPFFIDKMPDNYRHIGLIKAMLPQAKIIHLSRHPAATCLSIYEQDFAAGHTYGNDLCWLGEHYLQYRDTMEYWRSFLAPYIIEVNYESIVQDSDKTLGELGRRLDVTLDSSHASVENGSGKILTASFWQARQPIHNASVARWEKLKPQLQPLLETLGPILEND